VSSVGSFFSYINDAWSHEPEVRKKKNFTCINICTQYFILKVVFIHENLTSDMQLMLDLDTINTSDYLYILAYYILFCSMYYKSLLSQIFI